MNKAKQVSHSTRCRQTKKRVQQIIDSHRSQAFSECIAEMIAVSPNSTSSYALRLFDKCWNVSLLPEDQRKGVTS